MRKPIVLILMIAFIFTGCARTLIQAQAETKEEFCLKVTKMCKGREVKIITLSNESYLARDILMRYDTTFFKTGEIGKTVNIPTSRIYNFEYKDLWPGLISGFGVGAASGLLTVFGLGALGVFGKEYSLQGIVAIILIPLITITVGTMIGIENGSRVEIKINK